MPGWRRRPAAVGLTRPRNWCWNSSVVGIPTSRRSGWYSVATYSSIGTWPVAQYMPCSTYVSSLVTPASRIAKSAAVEVGNVRATYSSKEPLKPGLAAPRRPRRVGAGDARVEQADAAEVRAELLDLDQHAGRLAVERAAVDRHLDVGPLALGERADGVRCRAALRPREQDLVVVDRAVVGAVEDVGVEAVLVGSGVRVGAIEHPEAHLLRRAAGRRRRHVGPAGGGDDCRGGDGVPARGRVAVGMIELEGEGADERRVVEQRVTGLADEVGRDATAGEERPGSRSSGPGSWRFDHPPTRPARP